MKDIPTNLSLITITFIGGLGQGKAFYCVYLHSITRLIRDYEGYLKQSKLKFFDQCLSTPFFTTMPWKIFCWSAFAWSTGNDVSGHYKRNYLFFWHERAAFQRSVFGRSTAGNDVVATIIISLFFPFPPPFLIEGVRRCRR